MGSVYRDFSYGLKSFSRNPLFAGVFVAALAIGIGATISVFTVIDALVLRPLPVPHPEQLVDLTANYRGHSRIPISYPMFAELERRQRAFTNICGWTAGGAFSVGIHGNVSLSDVRSVTGNYYSVLRASPLLGRLINPGDAQVSQAAPVAVIGYELWQERFAGDPSAIGKSVLIDGRVFTIIGITQKWFTGMTIGSPPEITVPAGALRGYDYQSRGLLWLYVTGRLAGGDTLEHASAQLHSFWPRLLEATVPTESAGARRQSFLSMGLQLDQVATGAKLEGVDLETRVQRPLDLLLGIVALILLVICVNLASLTLARAIRRRQEISTRIALGASPWQAVRQFIAETLVLSSTGALLALPLSYWGSQLLITLMTRGQNVPALLDLRPDWRILTCAALAAIFTGLLTGLIPAWQLSRQHPGLLLQQSARTLGRGTGSLGKALIISQVAISLILLQTAGLFLRTLQRLKSFNPGFDKASVTELDLTPVPGGYQGADKTSYRKQLIEAMAGLPSVRSVAFSEIPILAGGFGGKDTVSSEPASNPADAVAATYIIVSPGFFRTLGIPFVTGRDFNWSDDKSHPHAAIIDNRLASQLFPSGDAIGKHIRFGVLPEYQHLEVVGVSNPARLVNIRDADGMFMFLPSSQFGDSNDGGTLLVRGMVGPGFEKTVEREVESFGHEYATRTSTVAQRSEGSMVNEEMTATLSGFFAAVALVVAGFGLFGLLTYSITLRTREIGIRMAMGSQRAGILRLILHEALYLTLIGIGIGLPLAIAASRIFAKMLFALSFADPMTLATASLMLMLTGVLAGLLPAIRAMKLEPMAALRHE
jgi:putative ABC transport system permease protein